MKMNISSKTDFVDQDISGNSVSFFEKHAYAPSQLKLHTHTSQKDGFSPKRKGDTDNPVFLVTMYKGIGDAVLVGLSFVDQIIKEEPHAFGKIDVLCTGIQAEIFEHDPRVNRIILTNNSLFSPSEMTMWLNGIKLDAETTALIHFLRERQYTAVFAFMFSPGFYLRLRSKIVYPNLLQLRKDFLSLSRQ